VSLKDLQNIVDSGVKLTPMMEQYFQIKKNYPDVLLLFRMGDFYEVFFEDARVTSKILNITLTHRGKIGDTPIPMAGIPHHAASTYIDRITGRGIKVAICEQIENPKDAIGIVKRAVTQVVSPGMPFDLDKTQSYEQKYMVSGFLKDKIYYLAALDFTTGDFKGYRLETSEEFLETIRILAPKEFITFMGQWTEENVGAEIATLLSHYGILQTHLSSDYFSTKFSEIYIEKLIPYFKQDKILKLEQNILSPVGALGFYVSSTQSLESFMHIRPFKMIMRTGLMKVTLPTLTGLEILPKNRDVYKDSLLGFFDKTETAMGARYMRTLFSAPLFDKKSIEERLDTVESILSHDTLIKDLRVDLARIRDIERILAKVSLNKCSASDLINVSIAITAYHSLLAKAKNLSLKTELSKKELLELNVLSENIITTLNDEIGASLEKGNLIREGVNKERDKLSKRHLNVTDDLMEMEARLRESSGILKLRIKSNNVAGFFIEVSKGSTTKVPKYFERRQTLVNAERYTTPELTQLEKETITAQEKLAKLEREIFKELINNVSTLSSALLKMSEHIAILDSFQSLASVALEEGFTRPKIHADKKILILKNAFHPLIKSIIKDQFVTHDLTLDEKIYFGLITGPNMAGKTTVMREVAIIQLLAQIGSFVPAKSAELGLCDFLFSRLGASDDILKGQSTFMVEMSETSEILRHATHQSLIILDEVGRGTSTYDGLSIAWGLVEHFIEETKALTLFATHYHELIDVVEKHANSKNLTVETVSHKGNVQFLYRLIEQGASQSFGIYVAKLAGIPQKILLRSAEILHSLEESHNHFEVKKSETPLHLKELEEELAKMDVMQMTPLEALVKLNQLKTQIDTH
jgi:DNA mismatch repair protein MutS